MAYSGLVHQLLSLFVLSIFYFLFFSDFNLGKIIFEFRRVSHFNSLSIEFQYLLLFDYSRVWNEKI